MQLLNFKAIGLGWNVAIFVIAAGVVWWAGDRLARNGSEISRKTKLGGAFIGTLLLGILVSLPQLVYACVAAAFGNAALAVNTLVGGIGITVVMLAIADVSVGREPLSGEIAHPVVLLQGVLTMLLLTLAAAATTSGDVPLPLVGAVGSWTTALFASYVAAVLIAHWFQRRHPWTPNMQPAEAARQRQRTAELENGERLQSDDLPRLGLSTAVAAIVVLCAGAVLAFTSDAIAEQTGVSAGLVGLVLGGISTSLPELSTAVAAARLRQLEMAYASMFGSNMCSIGLLFIADLFYRGGPILNQDQVLSSSALLFGSTLTAIYVIGLLIRPRRPLFGNIGIDSAAVFVAAAIGFVMLARLK
jgi:cation:H+ antiporter